MKIGKIEILYFAIVLAAMFLMDEVVKRDHRIEELEVASAGDHLVREPAGE